MEIQNEKGPDIISNFIQPYINRLFPGCIVGYANSKSRRSYGFGTQDGHTPLSAENFFDIASVTKALLNVVTLKKIPIEDLNRRVIDVIEMKGKYREEITIRNLLTFGVEYGDQLKLSTINSRGELLYAIQNGDLRFLPGSTYRYTNVSSVLLSLFLGAEFHTPFDKILQTELLNPLGMFNTSFDPRLLDGNEFNIVPTEAGLLRGIVQDESARLLDMQIGSAGLFSKMDDLLIFGQSFLGSETYLPKEILGQMAVSQFDDAAMTFGLGLGLRHQNECDLADEQGVPLTVLKKNGFSGVHFCVLPENDFCFVVFGNICYPKRPDPIKRDQFTLFHKRLLRLLYENRNELL